MGCKSSKVDPECEVKPTMVKDRKCRDIFCILLFAAWWVGMGFIAILAFKYGDAARLAHGADYRGQVCGSVGETYDDCTGTECPYRPLLAFPRIDQDMLAASTSGVNLADPSAVLNIPFYGVCRTNCPNPKAGDSWVCSYDILAELNSLYPKVATETNPDVPSAKAVDVLEMCLQEKQKKPAMYGSSGMSDNQELSNGDVAKCKTLLGGCWKMYVEERSLFFRCIPITNDNSTCFASPYLESIGEPVGHVVGPDGTTTNRKSSDPHCGECLDPKLDSEGNIMDPGSEFCRAKSVSSISQFTKAAQNPVLTALNGWTAALREWMGDIELCAVEIIVAGGPIAMVIGVVWLVLIRLFAGVFVWTTIWVFFFASGLITVQLFIYGGVITSDMIDVVFAELNSTGIDFGSISGSEVTSLDVFGAELAEQQQGYEYAGWAMLIFTCIILLMIVAMFKRIRIAVAIIKEATKAIATMPFILLFPIITVTFTIALSAYIGYTALFLSSMGEFQLANITELVPTARRLEVEASPFHYYNSVPGARRSLANGTAVADAAGELGGEIVKQFQTMSYAEYMWLFHIMGFLWTNQLISAIGCTTIAGAVASWYWASPHEKERRKSMPRMNVAKSFGRTLRYHVGSLIFGSFIIALVQLARLVLGYIDKQTKAMQKSNPLIKIILKVVHCCLWCFEKVLKYISKNAYILIAIEGSSFCTAAKNSFKLIMNNFARMGTATVISNLMIVLGRLVIVALAALSAGAWVSFTDKLPTSILIPVVVTAVIAWFVSGCFMNVYGLAIDTIMVSFCLDEKNNDGSPSKPYYMSDTLKNILKKKNKKAPVAAKDDGNSDSAQAPNAPPKKVDKGIL